MSELDRIKRQQMLTAAMREQQFQQGIRETPWYKEFVEKFGGEPNLQDPNYDYREAWDAGVRPDVRDPNDNLLHWGSAYKGINHPNRFIGGMDTVTGQPVQIIEPEEE